MLLITYKRKKLNLSIILVIFLFLPLLNDWQWTLFRSNLNFLDVPGLKTQNLV